MGLSVKDFYNKISAMEKEVPNPGVEPGSCRRHTASLMRATYTNRCTN